jgi:hypothetical protein
MAPPNGHAVHSPIETRPLVLTLGQIRVSLFIFLQEKPMLRTVS